MFQFILEISIPKAFLSTQNINFYFILFLLVIFLNTVNMVIFAGGKFSENVGKTFHVGVIFTILLLYCLHKGMWVLFFRVG